MVDFCIFAFLNLGHQSLASACIPRTQVLCRLVQLSPHLRAASNWLHVMPFMLLPARSIAIFVTCYRCTVAVCSLQVKVLVESPLLISYIPTASMGWVAVVNLPCSICCTHVYLVPPSTALVEHFEQNKPCSRLSIL